MNSAGDHGVLERLLGVALVQLVDVRERALRSKPRAVVQRRDVGVAELGVHVVARRRRCGTAASAAKPSMQATRHEARTTRSGVHQRRRQAARDPIGPPIRRACRRDDGVVTTRDDVRPFVVDCRAQGLRLRPLRHGRIMSARSRRSRLRALDGGRVGAGRRSTARGQRAAPGRGRCGCGRGGRRRCGRRRRGARGTGRRRAARGRVWAWGSATWSPRSTSTGGGGRRARRGRAADERRLRGTARPVGCPSSAPVI